MVTRKQTKTAEPPAKEKTKSLSRDLLLAGIGAWVHSRGRKGKDERMPDFASLVRKGSKAEPEFKASMNKTWDELKGKVQSLGSGSRLAKGGDRLRGVFDERVSSAISSLGLPTRKEIDALQAKVDRLLAEGKPARRRAAAKKSSPAPRKSAAKKTAAKSASAREGEP